MGVFGVLEPPFIKWFRNASPEGNNSNQNWIIEFNNSETLYKSNLKLGKRTP